MKVKYMLSQPGWVHTLNTSTKQIFDENSPDSNPMSFIFYDFFFFIKSCFLYKSK